MLSSSTLALEPAGNSTWSASTLALANLVLAERTWLMKQLRAMAYTQGATGLPRAKEPRQWWMRRKVSCIRSSARSGLPPMRCRNSRSRGASPEKISPKAASSPSA
jgi:hypothetical protein